MCVARAGTHEDIADRIAEHHALGIQEYALSGCSHLEDAYRVGEGVVPVLRRRDLLADTVPPDSAPTARAHQQRRRGRDRQRTVPGHRHQRHRPLRLGLATHSVHDPCDRGSNGTDAARTHSVHDPVDWKCHHIGPHLATRALPPNHAQI